VEALRARPELELLPAAQHHDLASMHQELLDVGGLDARVVMGPGLVPVPRPSATGPELEVLAGTNPVHFHPAPGDRGDLRRSRVKRLAVLVLHRSLRRPTG